MLDIFPGVVCTCHASGIDLVENARVYGVLRPDKIVSLARNVEKKCAALSDDIVHAKAWGRSKRSSTTAGGLALC